ncbi:MAG: ATP-binding cassette domain-containing protein, partial [Burkholderiales bacterium]|nr:ATP-binding cassette domain-containing protein [Burkholderiales bacterium]
MRRWTFPAFALLMLALPALPVPDFWITQSNYIGLSAIVALGLVLLTGVGGLTSFGQAAFVGVGAYTAAFLATKLGVSPWLTLFAGLGLAVLAALVVGAVTLRMSGHYLPLATIAWGLALNYTMANMDWLGKYDGLLGIPTLKVGGWDLGTGRGLHVLIWAIALAAALGITHLLFLGSAVVRLVDDQLQVLLPKLIGTSGNFETIVFGIVLVVVLKYAPDGLWTFVARWLPAPRRARDWDGAAPLALRDKPARGQTLLEVDAVRKEFGGLVAVNDVSFRILAGDIVGLIGPNGAGKSTTFNLVTGVLPLTRGAVRFRGQPIGGLPSREIAQRGVSRTFQHVKM